MYSSFSDIEEQVSSAALDRLTDDGAGAEEIVNEAIVAADEVIDAHLRGRYTLPFADVPPILRDISADISIFHLYGRRPEGEMPETIGMKYKNAVRMLESIRDGELALGNDGGKRPEGGSYGSGKMKERRLSG